jgi:hypothetical protein
MAESSVPFCLSVRLSINYQWRFLNKHQDGTDPPVGTATRELLEIVRASIRDSGLDPELRLKLCSEVGDIHDVAH